MQGNDILRIGVISDSHHDPSAMQDVLSALWRGGAINAVCFLGDCMNDTAAIQERLGSAPLYSVRGNNDLMSSEPDERVVTMGGKRFLLTHGHLYRVKMHRLQLLLAAQQAEVDVALFGHTHQPECGYEQGILLFNPGACSGRQPTCGIITIERGVLRADILRV